MANPVQRLWRAIRTGIPAALAQRLSQRQITHARALEPALAWEFDFNLRDDSHGPYFTNWRDSRVSTERVRTVAADLDRLLAHIHDPDAGIPDDTSMSGRSPWGGQAFAMQDPQFSGKVIDVNLSRRFGVVEVDIPTGASEQPVRQSIRDVERLVEVIRKMLGLLEERLQESPAETT